MDLKKWGLYGGIGIAVLAGGYMLLKGGGSSAQQASTSGAYYPPSVFSSGGGTSTDQTSAASGTSATDSIAQLLAGQLSIAQLNADTTKYTQDSAKDIALGQQSTDLATAKVSANASIENSLASQLGAIVKTFQSSSSSSSSNGGSSGFFGIGATGASGNSSSSVTGINGVNGSIGFNNGVISVDLNQTKAANTNAAPVVKRA